MLAGPRLVAVLGTLALAVFVAAAPGFESHVLADDGAARQQASRPAGAPDAEQRARGKIVFDAWCADCHAPGPRHPGTQALDALYRGKKPGALEARTDLEPKLTETFVRKGVSVMPPFRKTEITDAQLADVAAYLAPKPPDAR